MNTKGRGKLQRWTFSTIKELCLFFITKIIRIQTEFLKVNSSNRSETQKVMSALLAVLEVC